MASKVRSGGISSLNYLGCVDARGVVDQKTSRQWITEDNGNPDDILDIAQDLVSENVMFTIERNFNKNVCCYDLDNGQVHPKWLMIPDDEDMMEADRDRLREVTHLEDLNMVEKQAYGVDVEGDKFVVKALRGEELELVKDHNGSFRSVIHIHGQPWFLKRIFLHTKPNMLNFPSVHEIHVEVTNENNKVSQFFFAV
jgi:hypothetical protein